MTTKIFEELPSGNNRPPVANLGGQGPSDMKVKIEKRVSQAASDIRYKAESEKKPVAQAYKEYMANSSLSGQERNMVKAKIFGKSMAEDYNIQQFVSSSVANALFKVFVEDAKEEYVLGEEYLEEMQKKNSEGETLFSVVVRYKNGTSYKRWATRARMNELESNPNVESVNVSDTPPNEGEKLIGGQSVGSKSSRNDGNLANNIKPYDKVTRGDVIAGARGEDRMGGRRRVGVREDVDFLDEKINKKVKKFELMRGKKKNNSRIRLFPEVGKSYNEQVSLENGYSKFLDMVTKKKFASVDEGAKVDRMVSHIKTSEIESGKSPKESENIAWATANKRGMLNNKNKKKVEEESACDSSEPQRDMRDDQTIQNNLKNKLRSALGVNNPMIMTAEGIGFGVGVSKIAGQIMSNPTTSAEQGAKNFQKNVADPIGKAAKGAVRAVLQPADMSPKAQKARNNR
jgi:hypothetical protein